MVPENLRIRHERILRSLRGAIHDRGMRPTGDMRHHGFMRKRSAVSSAARRVAACVAVAAALAGSTTVPALAAPGDLDPRFGGDGRVYTPAISSADDLALLPDGRIVVVGGSIFSPAPNPERGIVVARYLPNGDLDPSFSRDGMLRIPGREGGALAIDARGRILVGGHGPQESQSRPSGFLVSRVLPEGRLDRSFHGDGRRVVNLAKLDDDVLDLALLPGGKILVAGRAGGDVGLARLLPDGRIDPAFGVRKTDFGGEEDDVSLALRKDGRALVAASIQFGEDSSEFDIGLARYLPDGSLDPRFGDAGRRRTDLGWQDLPAGLALLPSGKFLLAGSVSGEDGADMLLARYLGKGTLDRKFDGDGYALAEFPGVGSRAASIDRLPDGRVALGGSTAEFYRDFAVAVFRPGGKLDSSFSDDGMVTVAMASGDQPDEAVYAVEAHPAGFLVAAGWARRPNTDLALAAFQL